MISKYLFTVNKNLIEIAMNELIIYFMLGGIVFLIIFIILLYFGLKIRKALKKPEKRERPTSFKCIDGHIVKSKGELIIDNYLYRLGIEHEYEKTIMVHGNPIKYDWYLPKYKIYIEYWGYFGKEYEKRKEEKIRLYRKGKLNLISIEDIMLTDIYLNLKKELERYLKLKDTSKYCPNCGTELDKRFLY